MQEDERPTMQFQDQTRSPLQMNEIPDEPRTSFQTDAFQAPAGGGMAQRTTLMHQPPPALAWLIVMSGHRTGHVFPINAEGSWIGRDAENDIVLDDSAMSGRHAKVWKENNSQNDMRFYVQDLASTNGTYVNDQNVVRAVLKDGDRVRAGETVFVFKTVEPAAKPAPKQAPIIIDDTIEAASQPVAPAMSETTEHCTNCGSALAPNAQFCYNCGTPVARATTCPNGHSVQSFMKFCPVCGATLRETDAT